MKCDKCGSYLDINNLCPSCNGNTNNIIDNKKKNKVNIVFIVIVVILVLLIGLCSFYLFHEINKNDTVDEQTIETIQNLKKKNKLKFKIKDNEFYIGDKVSVFLKAGFTIDESNINNNIVLPDSIVLKTFYYDNVPMFSGALYCASTENCTYEDSMLIKATFYPKSKVLVNDEITFDQYEKKVNSILGEPDGEFYQDKDLKVWCFGKEVGDYYYIIRYDKGSLFSTNGVNEIRIGIWWFEGEKSYTVKKIEVENE